MTDDTEISVLNLTKRFNNNQANYALEDISFKLEKGNILGLIGDNGAGKSTLLRIISGLTKPDSGTISFRGRLSYILDIGSCFHPDLSGLDNIYLLGRVNGFSNAQIKQRVDEIIEFSELKNFINTPLKHYSNGMYLRLAFTANTSFYSDILLLDEIMSVGDLHFQQKAKERINKIVTDGTTVIMTGHDMESLSKLCSHGLWLAAGKQVFFGEINETIDKYLTFSSNTIADSTIEVNRSAESLTLAARDTYIQHIINDPAIENQSSIVLLEAGIKAARKTYDDDIYMEDEIEIFIRYQKKINDPCILFSIIQDKYENNLMSLCSHRLIDNSKFLDNKDVGIYCQIVRLPSGLFNQGVFSISFCFTDSSNIDIATFRRKLFFKIFRSDYEFGIFNYAGNFTGSLLPFFDWESRKEEA